MMDDRVSNPFATKFVGAGRLPFLGMVDETLDNLAETFVQQNFNGQIIGPHGVGKTTLTFELEKRVERLNGGRGPAFKFFRKIVGQRGAVRSIQPAFAVNQIAQIAPQDIIRNDEFISGDSSPSLNRAKTVLVIDGVERLSWFQRVALVKSCQRKRIGLLLTCHRPIWGLPTLVELTPDLSQFESVFNALTADCEFQLSSQRLGEIFRDNNENAREALMSCYDEFEARRARTDC